MYFCNNYYLVHCDSDSDSDSEKQVATSHTKILKDEEKTPQPFPSTGPNECLKEKEEFLNLWCDLDPRFKYVNMPEFNERLSCLKEWLEEKKSDVEWLEKVEKYFVAIDAGLTPSVETEQAFESRKSRYLGHVNEKGSQMAGPLVDYNNPLNIH